MMRAHFLIPCMAALALPVLALAQETLPPALPTVPAASGLPVTGEIAPPILPTAAEAELYSYGTAPYSLLFAPAQIEEMKKALITYERMRDTGQNATLEVVEEVAAEVPKIVEPNAYPVYYLSSIVYRDPKDWTVWLSGQRITPKSNEGEVRVIAVSDSKASFVWQPTYMEAVSRRNAEGLFADSSKLKHRYTPTNTYHFDAQGGKITFTLRPNQSFSPAYMHTFEGKVAPAKLDPLPALAAGGDVVIPQAETATPGSPQVPVTGKGLGQTAIQRMLQQQKEQEDLEVQQRMNDLVNTQQQPSITQQAAPGVPAAMMPIQQKP